MRFQISLRGLSFLVVILLSAGFATAENITKPYDFTPNTPASAKEVNDNFDLLYDKINELSSRLESCCGGSLLSLPPADYDSDWFLVEAGKVYNKNIRFDGLPKTITAYCKVDDHIFPWEMGNRHYSYDSTTVESGILLDFDENGTLYIRTPSGNTYNNVFNLWRFRNRADDGYEYVGRNQQYVMFRVFLWK